MKIVIMITKVSVSWLTNDDEMKFIVIGWS